MIQNCFHRCKDETDIEEDENIEGTSKKSPNENSPVKSKFGGDPLLRKVFEKHYGSPKKTSSKTRGKENRDEPGPSKQREPENLTDSLSTFDNSPMLKRPKQSKYFQTSKNLPQPKRNDESESLDDTRDITGQIHVNMLSKQTRTPWSKEEDLKLVKH